MEELKKTDERTAIDGGLAAEIGGFLPAGTIVASHYVGYDPVSGSQEGYVDFDAPLFTSTTSLAVSDYLANTGVTYLNPGARGLESGDSVCFDAIMNNRMNVDWYASSPGDYVRVLTAFSPGADNTNGVPDGGVTAAIFGMGLLALGGVARRRK